MRGNMSTANINAFELTRNSILRITDKQTMQLLQEYKNEECLWNTALEDYPNKSERQRAAEKIAKKLNIKNFEARHVMIKFKNLRNSYSQELKKIAHSLKNEGAEDPAKLYKPRVQWFPLMDSFIRPHIQPARTHYRPSIVRQMKEKEADVKMEYYESDGQEDWAIQAQEDDIHTATTTETNQGRPESCPSESDELSSDYRAKRPRRSTSRNPPSEHLSQTQVFLQDQAPPDNRTEDTFDNFGKYIASLLRSLPAQDALMLQPRIVNMIVEVGIQGQSSVMVERDRLGEHSETD